MTISEEIFNDDQIMECTAKQRTAPAIIHRYSALWMETGKASQVCDPVGIGSAAAAHWSASSCRQHSPSIRCIADYSSLSHLSSQKQERISSPLLNASQTSAYTKGYASRSSTQKSIAEVLASVQQPCMLSLPTKSNPLMPLFCYVLLHKFNSRLSACEFLSQGFAIQLL